MVSLLPNPNIIKYDNFRCLRGYLGRNNSFSSCLSAVFDFGQISQKFHLLHSWPFFALRLVEVKTSTSQLAPPKQNCEREARKSQQFRSFFMIFLGGSKSLTANFFFCVLQSAENRANTKICHRLIWEAKNFQSPRRVKSVVENECAINFWVQSRKVWLGKLTCYTGDVGESHPRSTRDRRRKKLLNSKLQHFYRAFT